MRVRVRWVTVEDRRPGPCWTETGSPMKAWSGDGYCADADEGLRRACMQGWRPGREPRPVLVAKPPATAGDWVEGVRRERNRG